MHHGLVLKYCLGAFGPDSHQEFPLCPGLPNQEAWPAKWLDSGEPTAREGFVLRAHFDAGTRLRLHKETHAPSSLRPRTEGKNASKQALNFHTTYSTHSSNVALRVISHFLFF